MLLGNLPTLKIRDVFAQNPEQYAPQYGDFCAWTVAEGYTAPVDPNAWEIVDGKLYLNYDDSHSKAMAARYSWQYR